jgi:hypothetical protein
MRSGARPRKDQHMTIVLEKITEVQDQVVGYMAKAKDPVTQGVTSIVEFINDKLPTVPAVPFAEQIPTPKRSSTISTSLRSPSLIPRRTSLLPSQRQQLRSPTRCSIASPPWLARLQQQRSNSPCPRSGKSVARLSGQDPLRTSLAGTTPLVPQGLSPTQNPPFEVERRRGPFPRALVLVLLSVLGRVVVTRCLDRGLHCSQKLREMIQ